MTAPLVSVIMPAYNASRWIQESIESALHQTYPAVEIIIIDDVSTDNTADLVQPYLSDRVRLIRNEKNLAVAGSRNRGIQAARGDYIALLDSDDLWVPDKLEKQMRLFSTNPNLGLVYGDCINSRIDGKTWRFFEEWVPHRGDVFHALLKENFIPCLSTVIPKRILDEVGIFNPSYVIAEEYELFLRIARKYPFDYIDEPVGTYRIHDQNISRKRDGFFNDRVLYLSLYNSQGLPLSGALALTYIDWSRWRWQQKQWFSIMPMLFKGLRLVVSHPIEFSNTIKLRWAQKKRSRYKGFL